MADLISSDDTPRKAVPQKPPFAFPEIIRVNGADYFKDDAGTVIMMGYYGPTPGGFPVASLWVVTNDVPTSVHPSTKYVHQRYRCAQCASGRYRFRGKTIRYYEDFGHVLCPKNMIQPFG
jgi:hypothetical protein